MGGQRKTVTRHMLGEPRCPRAAERGSYRLSAADDLHGAIFVVIMSDEPQRGIKMRRRSPETESRNVGSRNRLAYWRSPFAGPYSTW